MKSLIIVNDFPPILGGQSTYYHNLCLGLPSEKIIVLAPQIKGARDIDRQLPFTIIRKRYVWRIPLLEKAGKIILPFFYALSLLKKGEINRIHCAHVLSTGVVGLLIKKLKRIPYVVYTHSADMLGYQNIPIIKSLLASVLKNADHVVCNSHFTKKITLNLNVPKERSTICYPRIDYKRLTRPVETSSTADKYNLHNKRIILSVNRLVERKGNDMVIKALPEILKKITDAIYVIVGTGPCAGTLHHLADELNVTDKVLFLPEASHEEIRALYNLSHVFIMASRALEGKGDTEGFGIVFLEANAFGKPVIGGRSGGIPDAVLDGQTGLLIDPLDISDIAQALNKILTNDLLSKSLGDKGRQRVQNQFDYQNGIPELSFLFAD